MLERISVASIFISFNGSQIALHVSGAPPEAWLQAGHERSEAYFLSFSAAIARVAASITSLGARAMPSL
jgi:hypothetical protein